MSDYDDSTSATANTIRLIREEGRRQGWAEAIAALRDNHRFVEWGFETNPTTGLISDICADYLADQVPKGETT